MMAFGVNPEPTCKTNGCAACNRTLPAAQASGEMAKERANGSLHTRTRDTVLVRNGPLSSQAVGRLQRARSRGKDALRRSRKRPNAWKGRHDPLKCPETAIDEPGGWKGSAVVLGREPVRRSGAINSCFMTVEIAAESG